MDDCHVPLESRANGSHLSPQWTAILAVAVLLIFGAAIFVAVVPMTYCPGCQGTGVKNGEVTAGSRTAAEDQARFNPCVYDCGSNGSDWRKMTLLRRWTLAPRKP